MKSGMVTKNIAVSDGKREQYINYLSMHGGEKWQARTVIGSFQLKAKARSGTSVIESMDCKVSKNDGSSSYKVTNSDVTVSVSDECTVSFDTRGGTKTEPVSVKIGEVLKKPENPTKNGYTFTGWYTDENCTEKWDFSQKVQHNMTLYAGWQKKGSDPAVTPGKENDNKNVFVDVNTEDWFYDGVMYCYRKGIMNGMSENTFEPSLNTTRAMIHRNMREMRLSGLSEVE